MSDRLAILCHHAVDPDVGGPLAPWAVDPGRYEEHLDAVAATGMTVAALEDVVTATFDEGRALSGPTVVLTVDDGYADVVEHLWPRLQARGWPLTLYVTTAPVGATYRDRPMLDRGQVAELSAEGVAIGAHGHRHLALDVLTPAEADDEVRRSRDLLEDWTGRAVRTFAYPHGHHDRATRDLVAAAGFHSACAVKQALSSPGDDRFALARLMPSAHTSGAHLARLLTSPTTPVARGQGERLRTRAHRRLRRARHRRAGVAA